jgi:hypothetical protein
MASDFSVAWQCLPKRTIGFLLPIKLHALIRQGVSPPSFDTGARNGVLCGSQQSHLITEDNWPGRRLNLGLPNGTLALYPLLSSCSTLQSLKIRSFTPLQGFKPTNFCSGGGSDDHSATAPVKYSLKNTRSLCISTPISLPKL